jgi:hypothetical protein
MSAEHVSDDCRCHARLPLHVGCKLGKNADVVRGVFYQFELLFVFVDFSHFRICDCMNGNVIIRAH